jgi:hypothetical protein
VAGRPGRELPARPAGQAPGAPAPGAEGDDPAAEDDEADALAAWGYWRRALVLAVVALMLLAFSWFQAQRAGGWGLLGEPALSLGRPVSTSAQP